LRISEEFLSGGKKLGGAREKKKSGDHGVRLQFAEKVSPGHTKKEKQSKSRCQGRKRETGHEEAWVGGGVL